MPLLWGARAGSLTTSDLYTINPASGASVSVGAIGFAVTGLAMDPLTGILYGSTSTNSAANPRSIITIDPSTGAGTLVGSTGLSDPLVDIWCDDVGNLYGFKITSPTDLYSVNKSTGAATSIGSSSANYGCGTDFNPVDSITYGCLDGTWDPSISRGELYTVDLGTGSCTAIFQLTGSAAPDGSAIPAAACDESGNYFILINDFVGANPILLATVDLTSGVITDIGTTLTRMDALAWERPGPYLPVNTVAPTISGVPGTGHTLTATTGTWTGAPTITFAYQWQRGDAMGTGFADIGGETASTYLLTTADEGFTVRVKVTASNGDGDTDAFSSYLFIYQLLLFGAKGGSSTTSDLYSIDPVTGAQASIGPTGFALTGLAMDPSDNTLYGATSNNSASNPKSLITIDPVTGAGTLVGALGLAFGSGDIAFDPTTGLLYGTDNDTAALVSIDKNTGAASVIGAYGVSGFGYGMDFNSAGALYLFPDLGNGDYYTVNIGTGTATDVGNLDGPSISVGAASFNEGDVLYAVLNPSGATPATLVVINTSTGHVTTFATIAARFDALCWQRPPAGAGPPVNVIPPVIAGTAQNGETLSATNGTWTGEPVIGFLRQWQICDPDGNNCVDIPAATGFTYVVQPNDTGNTIRVCVTATNAQGSVTICTDPIGPIEPILGPRISFDMSG